MRDPFFNFPIPLFSHLMKIILPCAALLLAFSACAIDAAAPVANSPQLYPPADKLTASPGDTTYFVDPAKGDDANSGGKASRAWKSIAKINALKLAPGDKVVIAPGLHEETLKPSGEGTAEKPIVVEFRPGVHTFAVENAFRQPIFVSNSCDAPQVPKPIGILVRGAKHLRLQGGSVDGPGKTEILYAGRMVEIFNDHAEDVAYSGLVFDLQRPTVSELRVMDSAPGWSIVQIAEGSTYSFKDGKFSWTGDIGSGAVMTQQANPAAGTCGRLGFGWNPFTIAKTVEDLGGGKFKLNFANNYRLQTGNQFQFRPTFRDSVGVHNARSKDITLHDCDFYSLTNMGFVSQFTENITYQRVNVAPPKGTIRTCPAWGDIFQFSNCKGEILVDSCHESGMQDDAINCHGTHLRIIEKTADNQLLLRFMHPQTYGFAAYAPGDEIAVIQHAKLREYDGNPRRKVTAIAPKPGDTTGKDWLLTLDGPVPAFNANDVVDNITWYPNLTATNNRVDMDSCRGFLLTTRGKVRVENNTFYRCAMSGILSEDDAEGWFESGPVRDMLIRNNKFIGCGLDINPQTRSGKPEEAVHENIRIEGNFFDGGGVSARSVKGLTVTGNRSPGGSVGVNIAPSCSKVKVGGNDVKATE